MIACEICSKTFKHHSSLYRHKQNCKMDVDDEETGLTDEMSKTEVFGIRGGKASESSRTTVINMRTSDIQIPRDPLRNSGLLSAEKKKKTVQYVEHFSNTPKRFTRSQSNESQESEEEMPKKKSTSFAGNKNAVVSRGLVFDKTIVGTQLQSLIEVIFLFFI